MSDVPHLRFPEFSGEWDIATINPKSDPLQNTFIYIDLEAVEKGELRKIQEIMREEAPSRAQRVIDNNDILFQCVRPYQKNNYIHRILNTSNQQWVASTGYAQIRTTELSNYIYHLLNTDEFNRKVMVRCTGSSYPAINSEDLATIHLYYTPDKKEQLKISRLLDLLDKRIATQNKIIDKLQSLIKGIAQNVVRSSKPNVQLSECLECNSSTLQESDVYENGTYPVYGANGIVGYLDNYNTEDEAVYIIKDGSGVGTVSYVIGKCSATGTLNILQAKNGYSLQYLYYILKVFNFEPYKTGMAIPHIYFKDYGKAKIFCPLYTEQLKYAMLLSAIDNKLLAEQETLTNLSLQKQYLLHQMFI
jgi:type I restriction enzyme S subunit